MKSFLSILTLAAVFLQLKAKELPAAGKTVMNGLDPNRLPLNMVVYENSEVIIKCGVLDHQVEHGVQWWEYISSESGIVISHNEFIGNHPNQDRYSIIRTEAGEYSLRIRPVVMEDGGLYQCLDTYGNVGISKARHSAVLTILATAPVCTTTLPENGNVLDTNYHTNECRLSYQGLIPNITWSGIGPFNYIYVVTPGIVYGGMEYNVTRNMDLRSHLCDTFFTGYFLPVDPDLASNVPNYTHTYRERQMFVYWPPVDMYHTPMKEFYLVGDELRCFADAYPPPMYMWQNLITLEEEHNETIVLKESGLGNNHTYRCEARNVISGFLFTANYFTPVHMPIPTTPTIPTTQPPVTLPPAVSDCFDLTGAWESFAPARASLCIQLDLAENGLLNGLARNHTDTIWVDIVGRSTSVKFSQVGFAGIWPLEMGVSSFVGECHRCFGIERILAHVTNRVRGGDCGVAGLHRHTLEYEFYRSTTLRCPNF